MKPHTHLRPAAAELVQALDLRPPTAADPGYWKTADGFLAVNAGLIKDGYTQAGDRLRVLISFDPGDVQEVAKARMRKEFPDYDSMDEAARRGVWAGILQISKQARTERVSAIVQELDAHGVDVPVEDLVVHRVSNTFFATLDLAALGRIADLHRDGILESLRRIGVQGVKSLYTSGGSKASLRPVL